jgi:site-specific recombinase XerD
MADEFECWYTFKDDIKEFDWWQAENKYGMENDIETWLYSLDEHKSITVNGKEIDISSIESFYDFLVSQYKEKHNLTD